MYDDDTDIERYLLPESSPREPRHPKAIVHVHHVHVHVHVPRLTSHVPVYPCRIDSPTRLVWSTTLTTKQADMSDGTELDRTRRARAYVSSRYSNEESCLVATRCRCRQLTWWGRTVYLYYRVRSTFPYFLRWALTIPMPLPSSGSSVEIMYLVCFVAWAL